MAWAAAHPLLDEVVEHVLRAAVLSVLLLDLLVLSRGEVVGGRGRVGIHPLRESWSALLFVSSASIAAVQVEPSGCL